MVEETSKSEEVDRQTAAERLSETAESLRSGDGMSVRVGNKTVNLNPPETVNYRIDVIEKGSRLRGSRETVRIEIDWKP